MFKLKISGLLLVLLISITSCKLLNKPPKQPKLISIEWNKSGGMMPLYTKAQLSEDSCVWKNYNGITLQQSTFNLSKDELNELYLVFYANQFTKIESSKQEVLDRGGSDILINVDGKKYELLNSGTNFITDEYKTNYNEIENAIIKKCNEANKKLNKSFTLNLDESITSSKHNIVLYIDNREVYNEQKSEEFTTVTHSTQSNSLHFKILIMQKSNASFQTVLNKYELTLSKLPSDNDIILTLVDGKLIQK